MVEMEMEEMEKEMEEVEEEKLLIYSIRPETSVVESLEEVEEEMEEMEKVRVEVMEDPTCGGEEEVKVEESVDLVLVQRWRILHVMMLRRWRRWWRQRRRWRR